MVRDLAHEVLDWLAPCLLMLAGAYLFCSLATIIREAIFLSILGGVAGRLAAKIFGWL